MNALEHLEAWLEREHPGFADDKRLHNEARALSVAYTEGGEIAENAAASVAYLAHFGPRAIAAVTFAVESAPTVCVDVGAGSGASALALAALGAKRVVLVERNAAAIAVARKLLRDVVEVDVRSTSFEQAEPVSRAGLALSAFSFGEAGGEPRDAFSAIERIAPNAKRVVLVDAGDRTRARRIQELRDVLATEKRAIEAPCPHSDACPALVRTRDWCHTRIAKSLPDKLAKFARNVGRDDEAMALAYLVVAGASESVDAKNSAGVLTLGEPLYEKGRVRLPVCGPSGLRFVQALKRDRAAYDSLVKIERGVRLQKLSGERNAGGDTILVDDVVT